MNDLAFGTVLRSGGGVTERTYLDFVVDGRYLAAALECPDLITGVGWGPPEVQRAYIDRLLLKTPGDTPSGRVSLYICPECRDLGCGAISVRIEKTDAAFVWSEFGFEDDRDPAVRDRSHFSAVGPFSFGKAAYWELLHGQLLQF